MRMKTVAVSLALISSALSANAQTDMVWTMEDSPLRISLTDIVRHNQGGVYGLTESIYKVDERGRTISSSLMQLPKLINCRDMTTATFNVETKKLQIRPVDMRAITIKEFCSKNFIAVP